MSTDILSNLIITKIHCISTLYNSVNSENKRIGRDRWGIILKYEGETIYTSGGKQHISNANTPVILPKGCSYNWKCVKSGHYMAAEFDCDLTHDSIISFPSKNTDKLLRTLKQMEAKRRPPKAASQLELIRDMYSLLLMLSQSAPAKYQPNEKLKKLAPAIDFIENNYQQKIKNEQLAALSGLSTVYFRKLFSEVMGRSPIDYVQNVRIEKAKEMLQSDYGSLSDIATALGYPNIYDFSRAFKKHTGVPPSKYEKQENFFDIL